MNFLLFYFLLVHLELDETFGLYSQFESKCNQGEYDNRLKSATKVVSRTRSLNDYRDICENDLRITGFSVISFQNYINSVKKWKYKQKQIVENQSFEEEIKVLYQRATKIHYYDSNLWISFLSYLSTVDPKLIDNEDFTRLCSHAVMSSSQCMSNFELWALYLIALVL